MLLVVDASPSPSPLLLLFKRIRRPLAFSLLGFPVVAGHLELMIRPTKTVTVTYEIVHFAQASGTVWPSQLILYR